MKRTTGILMLLAVAGGCTSFPNGADLEGPSGYNPRLQPVPGPATANWKENSQMRAYQYAGGVTGLSPGTAGKQPGYFGPPVPPPMNVAANKPVGGNSPAALAAGTSSNTGIVQPASFTEPVKPVKPAVLPDLPEMIVPPKVTSPAKAAPPKDSGLPTDPGVVMLDHQPNKLAAPAVRLINSKRITINYEIKDVGPSGLSGVELWYTQDGKSWKKRDVSTQAKPPYVVEVDEEGLYGFTLLARNGIGLGKEAPQAGDLPQIWVEVDLTKPAVELTGINASCKNKTQNVIVRWKASDKNLGPKPITLSYATQAAGPWQVIAANVANTGRYVWPLPTEVPARFLVKVEASDLVGNVGVAQTPKPVLMDRSQPEVTIVAIEAGSK